MDVALTAAVMITAVRYDDIRNTFTGGGTDCGLRLTVNRMGPSTQAFWPLENKWFRGQPCDRHDHNGAFGKTSARTEVAGRRRRPGCGRPVSFPPLPPPTPGPHQPSLSAAFTLTPKSSRNRTMWWWPAQTALCRGVMPSSLGLLGSSTYDTGHGA